MTQHDKLPLHTTIHFVTDSKEARYLILSKSQPTKHPQLVLFLRQMMSKVLNNYNFHIHWVASHINIFIHDYVDQMAKNAAKSDATQHQTFPPKFKEKHFPQKISLSIPQRYSFLKRKESEIKQEIAVPPLSGNTVILITKFFINYLVSHPDKVPQIQPSWFHRFRFQNYTDTPCWKDNHLLVTALRTPYIVTHHPTHATKNALGWSCYQKNPKCPEFGFFSKNTPCSQLYLYPLSDYEIEVLNRRIYHNFCKIQSIPWRIAFFTKGEQNVCLRKFRHTFFAWPDENS